MKLIISNEINFFNLSTRIFYYILSSDSFTNSEKVNFSLKISRTIIKDHLSPKISKDTLQAQIDSFLSYLILRIFKIVIIIVNEFKKKCHILIDCSEIKFF